MTQEKGEEMLTARQYAELHDTPFTTVMTWLQRNPIPGAVRETVEFGITFWRIPKNAPKPITRKGPKPGTKRTQATKIKRRKTTKG